MDRDFQCCTAGSDNSQKKKKCKRQYGCLRRPYKQLRKKRSKRKKRKGKTYLTENRVPDNKRERCKSLLKGTMKRNKENQQNGKGERFLKKIGDTKGTFHAKMDTIKSRDDKYLTKVKEIQFSSVAQSCPTLGDPMDCSTPGSLSITNFQSLCKLMSIESVMPSNHLILCHPLLPLPSISPSMRVFSSESVLHIRQSKYWNFSFSISHSNVYSGLISSRTDWYDPVSPRDSQESSPSTQFRSINSSVFSFIFTSNFTSIHDYWKNHSVDQTGLCWQSNVCLFYYAVQVGHSFSSREQTSFNLMPAVTICNGFGAQENKVCNCFHFFPHLFAMKCWDQMP